MDPRKAEQIHIAMMLAMHRLESEYVDMLVRVGCKRITLYRI